MFQLVQGCQNMLIRYLWRHNNLICIFLSTFPQSGVFQNSNIQIYADLENHTIWRGLGGPYHWMLFPRPRNRTLWYIGPLTDESFSLSCRSQTSEMVTMAHQTWSVLISCVWHHWCWFLLLICCHLNKRFNWHWQQKQIDSLARHELSWNVNEII